MPKHSYYSIKEWFNVHPYHIIRHTLMLAYYNFNLLVHDHVQKYALLLFHGEKESFHKYNIYPLTYRCKS